MASACTSRIGSEGRVRLVRQARAPGRRRPCGALHLRGVLHGADILGKGDPRPARLAQLAGRCCAGTASGSGACASRSDQLAEGSGRIPRDLARRQARQGDGPSRVARSSTASRRCARAVWLLVQVMDPRDRLRLDQPAVHVGAGRTAADHRRHRPEDVAVVLDPSPRRGLRSGVEEQPDLLLADAGVLEPDRSRGNTPLRAAFPTTRQADGDEVEAELIQVEAG
jgi:hypothetical protein